MVQYLLHYFDARGFGECIRQQFILAGQPFEEKRYTFEEWPEVKKNMVFNNVPVLEVDGKPLPQSMAINRYLAKQFGFAGKGDWEMAQVDAIADQFKDFISEYKPYFSIFYGLIPGDVEAAKSEIILPAVKKHFLFFNNILKNNPSGYFVGENITFVDLLIAEYTNTILEHAPEALDGFSEIKAQAQKIHAIPRIKQWRETRPKNAL